MKIGLLASGNDMLTLFKFLSRYDHEYVIYYDFSHRPYGDKTFEEASAYVQQGVDFLIKQGVDKIILPPIYELIFSDKKRKTLPLFREYLMKECFNHSLVGKIGLLGDFADVEMAEKTMKTWEKEYKLTESQKAIKKFHKPFAYRVKETPLRKYYLIGISYSNILINKIIKFDLRYFKDAMVDTVIPLNYGYFNYQNTISKYLNFKKIRFHKLEKLEDIFAGWKLKQEKKYSVKVFYTGHNEFLTREKRLMRLLQRGKGTEVEMVNAA